MSSSQMYRIELTDHFKKNLKRLLKKDRSLKENLKASLTLFNKEHAIAIGQHTYKIRIKGRGKGKSGGYRAYLLVLEMKGLLIPVCIYPKNEKGNLSLEELDDHIGMTKAELATIQ